jgi:hypothetical protein
LVLSVLATAPANAFAASPPNDNRANARPLGSLPATVTGTTAEASQEARDPYACRSYSESVWYRLESPTQRAVSVILDAKDDLDAVVAVYRQQRSQLPLVTCRETDRRGKAGLAFRAEKDATYFILVAQQPQSGPGSFQLEVFAPEPPARPPGERLPDDGVRSTVDPLRDVDDAWSVVIPAGQTFRINLVPASGKCISPPSTAPRDGLLGDQSDPPARVWGIRRVHPGPRRRREIHLARSHNQPRRGPQRYRLQGAEAGPDDTSPGLALRHGQTHRGGLLAGAIDALIFTDSPWHDEATSRLQCTLVSGRAST